MPIPVNLYADRMSPTPPVRVADIYSATHERASTYTEAAAKIGLTPREYHEFRQALTDGGPIFVRLPRRLDAMAGVHRNGHVYALKNVLVPAGSMGWQVNLADGTEVFVPQICGNLSLLHTHAIAQRPRTVALRPQVKAVRGISYVASPPVVAAVPETPVTFAPPAEVVAPAAVAPIAAAAGHSAFPVFGFLVPLIGALHGGNNTPAVAPPLPPCSGGSNSLGACQQ